MSDLDLERLGKMWRAEPEPAEMEALRRSAQAVARRARWGQITDISVALLVSGVVILLALTNPERDTLLLGAVTILILLGSQIRQRRIRQVELRSLAGTTEEMLDQSIDRLRTSIRHNRLSLIVIGPALLIGYALASTTDRALVASADPLLRMLWLAVSIAVVGGLATYLLVGLRSQKRELERLVALRNFYRSEAEAPSSATGDD